MLKLEGQRIYLRDHQPEDLEVFYAWRSDPRVTRYLSGRTAMLTDAFSQLADALRETDQVPRTKYFLALGLKENQRLIGEAGLTLAEWAENTGRAEDGDRSEDGGRAANTGRAENTGPADLGYFLLPSYWGQGYATEAAQVLIAYAFTVLKLHKITAGCDAANGASEQVIKKCGLEREAYFKKHVRLNGAWRDRLEYGLLYADWAKRQAR